MIFKRWYAWFRNKRGIRDKNGVIINDFKRRKNSKIALKKIQSGEIKLPKKVNGKRTHNVNIEACGLKVTGDTK